MTDDTAQAPITEDDLERLQFIYRAFESRFEDWYVAEQAKYYAQHTYLGRFDDKAQRRARETAKRFSLQGIDEDGEARFEWWTSGDTTREYMSFSEILGTDEDFIERLEEEKRDAVEKARLAREATEKAEAIRKEAERKQREALDQARRDRIFREEAAKRGIKL